MSWRRSSMAAVSYEQAIQMLSASRERRLVERPTSQNFASVREGRLRAAPGALSRLSTQRAKQEK